MKMLGALLSLALPLVAQPAQPPESLSAFMTRRMAELQLVGAGVGVTTPDGSIWVQGFGHADAEKGVAATADTLAMWASCSKVVTGVAALQVLAAHNLSLDAPIAPHLPFAVVNPAHPQTPITFRMLLTHTSSILSDEKICNELYGPGDAKQSLGDFLKGYLVPGGRLFQPTHYGASVPGSSWVYSNVGFSLLGYLVERNSGMPFNDYCQKYLFQPLGLKEASWFLRDLDPSHVAVQYGPVRAGESRVIRPYGWPGYPDGMLRCSARAMLRMLTALARGGRLDGAQLLAPPLLAEMFKPQALSPTQLKGRNPLVSTGHGLVWRRMDVGGHHVWTHNGAGSGMTTLVFVDDRTGSAAVAWVSGGVIETPAGQAFLVELHRKLVAWMERPDASGH